MRKKYFRWVIVAIVFVLAFPLLLRMLIVLSSTILTFLNITPILYITNIDRMEFSDYVSIIVSLSSCICSGVIGYIAYRLSLSIRNDDLLHKEEKKAHIRENIADEILHNSKIIKNIETRVHANYEDIMLSSFKEIETIEDTFREEDYRKLKELYNMFQEYKNEGKLTTQNRKHWIRNDGSVKCEEILSLLKKKEQNNE